MVSKYSNPQGMQNYAAPSLFQPHRMRQALRDAHEGKIPPLIGYWLGLSSVAYARVVASMGFDVAWIDWEHNSCNVETMTEMVHTIAFMSEGKTIPLVRVPGHDHAAIGYALDAGASIVVPQVDTVEQARCVVSATKFGTKCGGSRSGPPFRLLPGISNTPLKPCMSIFENLNHQAAIIIQIESLQGIDNLDDILTAVPNIDAVWLGTLDCRISMGLDGLAGAEPEWLEAVEKFKSTLAKHDMANSSLALGTPEQKQQMGEGKAFVVTSADVAALLGHLGELSEARELFRPLKQVNKPLQNGVSHTE
ncbi:Phosphoenolpyruvate/pyruvate domain-containing protein [Aulographum hederae CBS 113979]|uniref:Phosphoenolpyruvate/pyruvate domain-containing protein n=1 Tax=Aulographum hederae CBS 113979 TaxID=1176131 RepID=A0A6G1HBT2_9PEZI|nr:Phosphoenolpyruvate/pyruvate domain-containing protein [Aulographum hederae CBS 113979]